jgi:Holliday junction resolvase
MGRKILKKRERKPTKFDALKVFAAWAQDNNVAMTDKKSIANFSEFIAESLKDSLSSEALLYGNRTQTMFEAVVANLGAVQLVKSEDSGDIYNVDSTLEVPDTRVILHDGRNLLVEVKNCHMNWQKPYRVKKTYLSGLVRYAELVGAELLIAIFWSQQQRRTLVPASALVPNGEQMQIGFLEAFKANEMSNLGDNLIGCGFPVVIRGFSEKKNDRLICRGDKWKYFINSKEITGRNEQRLLFFIMIWGEWEMSCSVVEEDAHKRIVDTTFMPMEELRGGGQNSGDGCVFTDSLSTVLSRYWRHLTSDQDGKFESMLPMRDSWGDHLLELTDETSKLFAIATVISPAQHMSNAVKSVD